MRKIAAIFMIILLLSACSEYSNLNSQSKSSVQSNSAPQQQVQQTPIPTPTKEDLPTVYEVGQEGPIGLFSFTVKNTIETNEYNGKKSENKYVIVTVEAKNIGKESKAVDAGLFLLIDDKDRQFKASNEILYSGKDEYFSIDGVNPGLKKTGKVAFEVPLDVSTYGLAARDNMFDFGGAKYVFYKLQPVKK